MVAADSARIANNATTFVRVRDESIIPFPQDRCLPRPYTEVLVKRPYRKDPKDLPYPSMVSRRQCRAVSTMSTSATQSDAAADTPTSSAPMGSSLSTLVINRCWLNDG